LDRKEAVALVKELGDRELIKPTFVIINRDKPNRYNVQIKGDFDRKEIELFLKNRGYSFEENNDYLIISKQ
jgi:hypothetical protein